VTLIHVSLSPVADLQVSDVSGPTAVVPGESVTVTYTSTNAGQAAAHAPWRDDIYLDTGTGLQFVGSLNVTQDLAAGVSAGRSATFSVPSGMSEGNFRWVVKTDAGNAVYERANENNNQASAAGTVVVARPDLVISEVSGPSTANSAETIHVQWRVTNEGNRASGSWVDRVYLSSDGTADGNDLLLASLSRNGPLNPGEFYDAAVDVSLPIDADGAYKVLVVTNATNSISERPNSNNQGSVDTQVAISPYADLAVSNVTAPALAIDDPASVDVAWTVKNQGTGAGRTAQWTDRVMLVGDSGPSFMIGEFVHDGALQKTKATRAANASFSPLR